MHKILIVDDEKKSRDHLADIIHSILPDAVITQAGNPLYALALIRENDYSLLFSDIVMPKMDGLEMIQKIGESKKELFIVLISAYDKFEYAQKGMELGASGYILKPFNRKHVTQIIEKYVEKIEETINTQTILFSKGHGKFPIKINDIVAIERFDRFRVHLYTKTEQIQHVNGTLSAIMEQLPDYFFRINRQCIVNTKIIKHFNKKSREVSLNCGHLRLFYTCSRDNIRKLSELF